MARLELCSAAQMPPACASPRVSGALAAANNGGLYENPISDRFRKTRSESGSENPI